MTRSEIARDLQRFTGSATVTVTELAQYVGMKNRHRVKQRYLLDDPDSAVPIMKALGGRRYMVQDVATRLLEDMQ